MPSLPASHGDVANEHGDTSVLARDQEVNQTGYINSGIPQSEISPNGDLLGARGASSIGDNSSHQTQTSHSYQDDEAANIPSEEEKLGAAIRLAIQHSKEGDEKSRFLPIDDLNKIVTWQRVRMVLESLLYAASTEHMDLLANRIWNSKTLLPSGEETSRKKLFAILALMDKVRDIDKLVEEDIYDSDMPFKLSDDSSEMIRKGEDGNMYPVKAFARWKYSDREYFARNAQWQFLAPYFRLSTRDSPEVEHYDWEHGIVLPFTKDEEFKYAGGFSEVTRVKIHPAHHNCCLEMADENENPHFALKRLRHSDYAAFQVEVSNLKRFCGHTEHPHLIKLLSTFKLGGNYYLLFPWADGNLLDFWKVFPNPADPIRSFTLAMWFSTQCLGIAEGLKMIHSSEAPVPGVNVKESAYRIHGRHGDLKPENILWFKTYKDSDHNSFMGVLKISDFGLTRFHKTASMSRSDPFGISPTYRAPEYDVRKKVSQSYDVWSLGCVILEFITWYILGWDEVQLFEQHRVDDDNSTVKEDVFFNHVKKTGKDGRIQYGARFKSSVANEFQNLRNEKGCSDYMLDLLDFVEKRLLRMGPKKRADCTEIVNMFTELNKRCLEDSRYCTHRTRSPSRAKTNLSELTADSLDLSSETIKVMERSPIPEHPGLMKGDSFTSEPDRMDEESGTNDPDIILPTKSRQQRTSEWGDLLRQEPDHPTIMIRSRSAGAVTSIRSIVTPAAAPTSGRGSTQTSPSQSPNRRGVHFEGGGLIAPDMQSFKQEIVSRMTPEQLRNTEAKKQEQIRSEEMKVANLYADDAESRQLPSLSEKSRGNQAAWIEATSTSTANRLPGNTEMGGSAVDEKPILTAQKMDSKAGQQREAREGHALDPVLAHIDQQAYETHEVTGADEPNWRLGRAPSQNGGEKVVVSKRRRRCVKAFFYKLAHLGSDR